MRYFLLIVGGVCVVAIASVIYYVTADDPATMKSEAPRVVLSEGSSPPLPPRPSQRGVATSASPRVDAAVPVQSTGQPIEWDAVPLDAMGGFHTFGDAEFVILQDRMLDLFVKGFRSCAIAAKPPQTWDAAFEIHLEPVKGGYAIRDTILRRANYAVAELEACYRDAHIGRTIVMDGLVGPVRIEQPVRFVVTKKPAPQP